MVKRKDVVAGTVVIVTKLMPNGSFAGPCVRETLPFGTRLKICGKPLKCGALNLVVVTREGDDEGLQVMYSFITNFCTLA